MESYSIGPREYRHSWIAAQLLREQIRPVNGRVRLGLHFVRDQPRGGGDVAPGGTHDSVGISESAQQRAIPHTRQRDDQHFGAFTLEAVDMTFERLVDQNIAGLDAMTPRVARFGIVPGEDECRESLAMLVTWKDFVGRVVRTGHAGGSIGSVELRAGTANAKFILLREL